MLLMINIKDKTKSNQVINQIPYYGVGGTHSARSLQRQVSYYIPRGRERVL